MSISAADLAAVRAEVGSTPDDTTIDSLWTVYGKTAAVALAILRPRLADALTAAARGGVTLTGVLGVTPPSQPTLLFQQISRLEAQLTDNDGDTGLTATSSYGVRRDRFR